MGIEEFVDRARELMFKYVMVALTKLGEECVVRVRDRSQDISWYDHTGNLRSSIGYAVYENGRKFITSSFATVGQGTDGSSEGMRQTDELAGKYSEAVALVVLAGMSYADYVEAIESKDVLESTKIWAETVAKARIERAIEEAIKEINTWKL